MNNVINNGDIKFYTINGIKCAAFISYNDPITNLILYIHKDDVMDMLGIDKNKPLTDEDCTRLNLDLTEISKELTERPIGFYYDLANNKVNFTDKFGDDNSFPDYLDLYVILTMHWVILSDEGATFRFEMSKQLMTGVYNNYITADIRPVSLIQKLMGVINHIKEIERIN